MRKIALITGATSGIGRATAYEFAKHGMHLILCGRRQERLKSIQAALKKQTEVHILNFDVRNKEETLKAIASLKPLKTLTFWLTMPEMPMGWTPFKQAIWRIGMP